MYIICAIGGHMTITINLTAIEEAHLSEEAHQHGLATPELVTKLVRDHIISKHIKTINRVRETLHKWQIETETDLNPETSLHELFKRWDEEDALKSDEDIAEEKRLWHDFQISIDEERKQAGMRTLFNA